MAVHPEDVMYVTEVSPIADLLVRAAAAHPDTDAVVFPETRFTYAALLERAMGHARSLVALGIRPGDHVGILLASTIDFAEIFFGITMIGAVAVPVNARYRAHELAFVIDNADLKGLITTDRIEEHVNFVERLSKAFPDLASSADPRALDLEGAPGLDFIVLAGDSSPAGMVNEAVYKKAGAEVSPDNVHGYRCRVRLRDPGLMLYTSGTTANPKGCPLTHEAMVRNSLALAHRYHLTADDKFWSPLPMFHIAAILPLCAILSVGGTYLCMTHFDAGVALRMMAEEKVTAAYPCFAPIMVDMINHPDFPDTDLSRIRLMNSNLAVQPPAVVEKIQAAMPLAIQVGTYGMTETSGTVCTSRLDDPVELRTTRLGPPLPGVEVKLVDPETGDEVPTGERGEILVRGYSLLDEYYRAPEKTAEAIEPDGWFHTGDVGSFDAHGQIMFHGRIKDMLKVGGENVAAAEIESFLAKHPAVKMAQVVGIPHPRLVEVPAAFIELNPGESVDEAELIAFCKGEISGFKVPRHVRFVESWPMSTSKIQKFRLRDQLIAELDDQERKTG